MDSESPPRVFAVIGNPVAHSMSPAMHNRAFSAMGYSGVYVAFQVKDIGPAVAGLRALGIKGASITIPHKIAVLEWLDSLDPLAVKIGAVNTVMEQGGRLIGYNSDGLGAVKALQRHTAISNKRVALIGAGGAARAIGFALTAEGAAVTIFNRSEANGTRLAQALGADFRPLSDFPEAGGWDILINTSPVGMAPNVAHSPVPVHGLSPRTVVMDIVYNPLKTRLLEEAERIGCPVVTGLSMFIHQGAFQFELWTGLPAPLKAMEEAVLEKLAERERTPR